MMQKIATKTHLLYRSSLLSCSDFFCTWSSVWVFGLSATTREHCSMQRFRDVINGNGEQPICVFDKHSRCEAGWHQRSVWEVLVVMSHTGWFTGLSEVETGLCRGRRRMWWVGQRHYSSAAQKVSGCPVHRQMSSTPLMTVKCSTACDKVIFRKGPIMYFFHLALQWRNIKWLITHSKKFI